MSPSLVLNAPDLYQALSNLTYPHSIPGTIKPYVPTRAYLSTSLTNTLPLLTHFVSLTHLFHALIYFLLFVWLFVCLCDSGIRSILSSSRLHEDLNDSLRMRREAVELKRRWASLNPLKRTLREFPARIGVTLPWKLCVTPVSAGE
jgi:hypothetical protein